MWEELFNNLKNEYTKDDLKVLEEIESFFYLNSLDDFDLLNLGNLFASILFEWNEQASISIVREKDGLTVYQFVSNAKAQRNIDFAMKKRNAVLKTGHCSFWGLVKQMVDGNQESLFLDESILCVAGAFPVYIQNEHQYTICISGMHEGKDFTLATKGISEFFDINIPSFSKAIL